MLQMLETSAIILAYMPSGIPTLVCHSAAVRAPAALPTIDRQKQIWQAPRCLPDLLKDIHKLRWRRTKQEVSWKMFYFLCTDILA